MCPASALRGWEYLNATSWRTFGTGEFLNVQDAGHTLSAVQDDNETPADDLETALAKYMESVSKLFRTQTDTATKIIEAVREYLAALPREEESPGPAQNTAPSDERMLLAWGKLVENSSGLGPLGQMQSLNMLAVLVLWLSNESGRSEAEILEQLGTIFADSGSAQSLIGYVTREFRDE